MRTDKTAGGASPAVTLDSYFTVDVSVATATDVALRGSLDSGSQPLQNYVTLENSSGSTLFSNGIDSLPHSLTLTPDTYRLKVNIEGKAQLTEQDFAFVEAALTANPLVVALEGVEVGQARCFSHTTSDGTGAKVLGHEEGVVLDQDQVDCVASELTASFGDTVVVLARGTVNSAGAVTGSTIRLNLDVVECEDQSGTEVSVTSFGGVNQWDCSGLGVSAGDPISTRVQGTVL